MPDSPECDAYMYAGQAWIQKLLVIVAVVSAPYTSVSFEDVIADLCSLDAAC